MVNPLRVLSNPLPFFLLQLLLVFVSGTFLVNNVVAKPLYLEILEGKLEHFERGAELHRLPVNETSQSRGKRDVNVLYGIADLCLVEETSQLPRPPSGCVQRWLHCKNNYINLTEPQCARASFACLSSVAKFEFPKCKPVYKWKQITFPNGQMKRLKLNDTCVCA